jgi:clan AA aspartic protease (TIGR02281 family)
MRFSPRSTASALAIATATAVLLIGPMARRTALAGPENYIQVPAHISADHYLVVSATVNGAACSLIVDTGAGATTLDTTRAAALGLPRPQTTGGPQTLGTGLGATRQPMWPVTVDHLKIGDLAIDSARIMVTDLSAINAALKRDGNPPADGVLGADILQQRAAVVDYRVPAVFLRDH